MGKIATKYLKVHPSKIIEEGYHPSSHKVSEALFSLTNEFLGLRAYFEEGSKLTGIRGSFFNGFYDYGSKINHHAYKGIVDRTHFMVLSPDFLKVQISIDDEYLEIHDTNIKDYYQELDFFSGLHTRQFTYLTKKKKQIKFIFMRLLDNKDPSVVQQRIIVESNDNNVVNVKILFLIDHHLEHGGDGEHIIKLEDENVFYPKYTKQLLKISQKIDVNEEIRKENLVFFQLKNNKKTLTRTSFLTVNKKVNSLDDYLDGSFVFPKVVYKSFSKTLQDNELFYKKLYENSDIEIKGDDEDQQGIRYCIFQLASTYHGLSPMNNIGAKGLTGIAYSGHAFWDSETYCLPFYLFNNIAAAKNLILFRYNTLPQAIKRAKMLDCKGACFPIATLNGEEACDLWQHASCQFQPTTAVVYAVWHYYNVTKDRRLLLNEGLALVVECCKFLLSRGQYDADRKYFGYYGVMGPDEFKMFVSHNAYTNYMAKFSFDFLLEIIKKHRINLNDFGIDNDFIFEIKEASKKMLILYDKKSKLYEQHLGYFKMPHIDIHKIPVEAFPLYHSWSYDRIYRYDMIKQPDVLMFMFLFLSSFSLDVKRVNYNYYEPRCIHESSLSPSIHSVFAAELGLDKAATDFFGFASRLDLDDYNRNTQEGLHLTSIAAAWLNVVYGFGGLRSDAKTISIAPTIPAKWESYSFYLTFKRARIKISVLQKQIKLISNLPTKIVIYNKMYDLEANKALIINK